MKIMKRNIYTLVLLCSVFGFSTIYAQKNVGIGTSTPDNSAVLDINSSDKGLLIPRMSLQQRNGINNPADGLMVYQTGEQGGFYFFEGKTNEWKPITEAKAVAGVDGDWTLQGNAAGATDFLGTTNAQPLKFKVNNINAGQISATTGNSYFGVYAGNTNTAGTGTGTLNTAIGNSAMFANGNGRSNVAIGTNALRMNTTGNFNVGLGVDALRNNTTSYFNIAIGANALKNTTGNGSIGDNTAIGGNALTSNTTGTQNIAIGPGAMTNNLTGSGNFGMGKAVMSAKTSGDNNLALGNFAGQNNVSGSNNIFIGSEAGQNETTSSKLYIANTATTTPLIYGDFAAKFVSIGDVDPGVKREDAVTAGGYKLLVQGGILTEKVKVALKSSVDWADYVFEDNYHLMPLNNVEAFVKINKHLPNVPSADEMALKGMDVAQTSKMFMEKIEELTLYIIELNKEVETLKKLR
jgi:hypothetical protein